MSTRQAGTAPTLPRGSRIITVIITIAVIVALGLPTLVGLYTDWLWFGEVDFRGVFTSVIMARVGMFIVGFVLAALIVAVSMMAAYRTRPSKSLSFVADDPLAQYREMIAKGARPFFIGIPALIGVLAGLIAMANWQTVMLFFNRTTFGVTDPQYGIDYGFYAFTLPSPSA